MTQLELNLEQKLKEFEYNKVMSSIEDTYEKFVDTHSAKEFEETEVLEEQYTIDNLLDVIDKLNQKLENLTDDYNNLLEDSCIAIEDIVYSVPTYGGV